MGVAAERGPSSVCCKCSFHGSDESLSWRPESCAVSHTAGREVEGVSKAVLFASGRS